MLPLIPFPSFSEPLAQSLVGEWTCQPKNGDAAFTWVVSDNLPGGWLIGEGYEDNSLSSVETWSFNSEGQLMERRQFASNGAFIQLSVVERSEETLSSHGELTRRDGESIPVQHFLRRINANQIEATWEVDEGSGWIVVADEVCMHRER
ncbi:hypothetical protein [Leptolyngbya sp. NM1-A1]|uniref:hypothetical protein n=1 Tax=Leptolyngbya sp. NM1-A1 TaxID=2933916 RepID=UPI00198C58F5|nr:hypothetical protein [Phormidium sp. FACHB-322]